MMNYGKTLLVASLAASALFLNACGKPEDGDSGPKVQPTESAGPTGTIRGHVKLQGDLPKPGTDTITQDQAICGSSVSLPRIAVGPDNGIESAFVFLEGVPSTGKRLAAKDISVLVDQKDSQYVPHALIVPFGSRVEITNSDTILHNVHGMQASADGMTPVFNYAQPQKGQRESVDMKMTKTGIVFLSCEAGHPWMNAYMYVTRDPFVALTDKSGEFVIKNVPPGTYTIKMWHEGVQLKKINKTLQQYEYEEPYETTQQVTVTADMESKMDFQLALRK